MAIELPELLVKDVDEWRLWLDERHRDSDGVRLVLAKKGVTDPTSLSYAQALDEALCFGWIDGQIGRRDEATFFQRFTPRRARSAWSANNVANVARLAGAGRMRPAGLAAVEQAKVDGRWEAAYAGPASVETPADLQAALDADPDLAAAFAKLTSQNRYALIRRVALPKQAETRARQLERMLEMLRRGETIHPQRRAIRAGAPISRRGPG